jgi:hypothetical protein
MEISETTFSLFEPAHTETEEFARPKSESIPDSIYSAPSYETEHSPSQRPVLPPPDKEASSFSKESMPAEMAIALINLRQEELCRDDIENCGKALEASHQRMRRIQTEKLKALEEAAARASSRTTWGILKNVASYLVSAASFSLGVGCLATGAGSAAAAFLVASGGLGLVNQVMKDTGGWEKLVALFVEQSQTRQQIARYMELGMTLLAIGVGVFGIGMGYYLDGAPFFAKTAARTEQITKGVQTANAFLMGSTILGSTIAEKRAADSQKKLSEFQRAQLENKFFTNELTDHFRETVQHQLHLQEQTMQCIESLKIDL